MKRAIRGHFLWFHMNLVWIIGTWNNDDGSESITRKNKFASFQTLWRLFGATQFVKCRRLFLSLNSEGLYPCSNREEKNCRSMSTSSIKRRIGRFHAVVLVICGFILCSVFRQILLRKIVNVLCSASFTKGYKFSFRGLGAWQSRLSVIPF